MRLSAVLFDLWETLIHDSPDRARARQVWRAGNVQAALRDGGFDLAFDAVDLGLRRAMADLTNLQNEGFDISSRGRAELFLQQAETALDPPDAVVSAVETAITAMHADFVPPLRPDAVDTLRQIRSLGLATALVSNAGFTTAPSLRWLLDHHGLRPHLDFLLFSDELQAAKPNQIVFAEALAALNLDASAVAFVGDSPHNDIAGAQAAGIYAVQIGSKTHADVRADRCIDQLCDLLPALREAGLVEIGHGAPRS